MTWILNLDIFQGLGGDGLIKSILLTASAPHTVTVSAEDIIAFVALMSAISAIFGVIFAIYRWYLHQQDQDKMIEKMRKEQADEIAELKKEQQLLTYGILACLDGLKQLKCNGSVTEAQDKISKHLNAQAHKV
jgi:predicted histidine transporter YuiF (NhaC family)